MLVKELMKRPFVVEKNISLAEAAKIMSSKNIGSLLLISGNKVKGIVTEKDLIRNFTKHEKISQVMSSKIISIEPDETLDRAVEIMRNNKIKRLPVLDEGKLVGIITLTDVMANFEALEEEFFFQ
jgi:CBS domain-containing protein